MRKRILLLALICMLLCGCTAHQPAVNIEVIPTPVPSPEPVARTVPEYIVNPYQPYTYDIMTQDVQALEEMYPQLIEVSSIGQSVEERELTLIRMGTGKTKLLLVGAHHAREYISTTFLMNMIDKYMYAAATDGADIKKLLSEVTVYIVPMLNPDGVNLVINGRQSAKDEEAVACMTMLKDTYAEWKANINGVDLNRQYPCHWEEKACTVFGPSSEMYKGETNATEPEVKAMISLCEANDFVLAASFHTKGEVIFWADSGTFDLVDGADQIASALSASTGYEMLPPSQDPAAYGAGFENWFRQAFEKPGFCIELTPVDGTSVPHDDADFDALVWDKAKDIGKILMESALQYGQ